MSPLRKAGDAIEIVTDDLTIDEVVAKIASLYQQRVVQMNEAASQALS
nr:(d)CMP kinase [Leptolyngbya sp. 7M]